VAEGKKAKSVCVYEGTSKTERNKQQNLRERNNKDCKKRTTEADGKEQSRLRERDQCVSEIRTKEKSEKFNEEERKASVCKCD
jgi:hypothetical protein